MRSVREVVKKLLRTSSARPTRAGKRRWRPWRLHLRRRGTVDHARLQRAVHRFHVPPAHVSEVAAFSDLDAGADFFVPMVSPSLPHRCAEGAELDSGASDRATLGSVFHRNLVEHCLSNRIAIFIPARPAVLATMQLRFDAWRSLRRLDRIEHGLLLPILLHCRMTFWRLLHGSTREGPEREELLHRLPRHFRCQSGSGLARCKRPAERIS